MLGDWSHKELGQKFTTFFFLGGCFWFPVSPYWTIFLFVKKVGSSGECKKGDLVQEFWKPWFTRWWFPIFFIFTPIRGRFPFWRAYFSDGLKPPTSLVQVDEQDLGVSVLPDDAVWTSVVSTFKSRKIHAFFNRLPAGRWPATWPWILQDPKATKSCLSEDSRGGAADIFWTIWWMLCLLDVWSHCLACKSVLDLQAVAMRQARLQRPKDTTPCGFWKLAHEFS